MEEGARAAISRAGWDPDRGVRFHHYPTTDAWCRDHGPIFVVRDRPVRERALLDFRFDNWGRKYPGFELDDAVPRHVEKILGLPRFPCDVVLEGGAIDGDGRGTVLTTESCLLNPNRGPGRTRERMERLLADQLGARSVLWLGEGIEGDDTDGHVDDVARFVAPGVVVAAVADDASDPNHAPLAENLRRLRAMRDAAGAPLRVVELPMPARLVRDGLRSPASHANFYLANGVALVPTFGGASDARALAILGELLPGREMVGIPSGELVSGFGAVHCVTQQEPA
jgi:agmatine deiminase